MNEEEAKRKANAIHGLINCVGHVIVDTYSLYELDCVAVNILGVWFIVIRPSNEGDE